jgi:hypothetical protein
MIDVDIPDHPEEMTPSWLNSILHATESISTGKVVGCKTIPIGEGFGFVGRTFRIAITYDSPNAEAPQTLVAKLHSKHP